MSKDKAKSTSMRKGARGSYRNWTQNAMKKALSDCNDGMSVCESARINDVPRGELSKQVQVFNFFDNL